jgi:hypothetical protein
MASSLSASGTACQKATPCSVWSANVLALPKTIPLARRALRVARSSDMPLIVARVPWSHESAGAVFPALRSYRERGGANVHRPGPLGVGFTLSCPTGGARDDANLARTHRVSRTPRLRTLRAEGREGCLETPEAGGETQAWTSTSPCPRATSTNSACRGLPRNLNSPNRRMRTRTSGGVGGDRRGKPRRPYPNPL